MRSACLLLAAACWAAAQPPKYELLIRGGHVVDPQNGVDGVMDVAVSGGRIAAVAPNIPPAAAQKVIDASGLWVAPGLVDIHAHVYAGTGARGSFAGDYSIYPDGYTFRACVTTVVDAGSAGWKNFEDFKDRVIDRSATRVLSMLNIVGSGMGGASVEQNIADMDAQATAKMALKYPGLIVGVKTAHYMAPDWVAVDRSVDAGKLAKIPVMVDFGRFSPERPYQELVLRRLRPGDISTHMYMRSVPLLDSANKLLPYLAEARKRGVKFDVGHGNASFTWNQAYFAIKQGWVPDSISTDAHIRSTNGGMKDMTTTMSKILALGVPMTQILRMSTYNPAQQIQRADLGHLSPGAPADISILRIAMGKFGLLDYTTARFDTDRKIFCEMTLREGKVVWDLNGLGGEDWRKYYKVTTQ